ncbi:MAG: nucleoside triphosphate pyrophosphatase YhdE [Anaerolineae bacterium]
MDFVLASRSPRRRDLLALIGHPFRLAVLEVDERPRPGEPPEQYARRLSIEKAQAAVPLAGPDALILAADTIVVDGAVILEKPRNADHAAAMLRALRGRTHRVLTAVTLLDAAARRSLTQVAASPVHMRAYTDREIADYIASGDPFDKAGAYGIQHPVFSPAQDFDHCFANVMGLPLCHIARMLRELDCPPPADVPAACQQHIGYTCPVYRHILNGGE